MPIIPALGLMRQEYQDWEASLGCIVGKCLYKINKIK
jgi:hypothetical protein